jgi:hypothetical protein
MAFVLAALWNSKPCPGKAAGELLADPPHAPQLTNGCLPAFRV